MYTPYSTHGIIYSIFKSTEKGLLLRTGLCDTAKNGKKASIGIPAMHIFVNYMHISMHINICISQKYIVIILV